MQRVTYASFGQKLRPIEITANGIQLRRVTEMSFGIPKQSTPWK